ncbi:MAG: hypothetical protein O3B24_08475 [Verrucomicrobia bacterium]|nr:hypothetical protein [Verrucomicrobiota bacterium]
MLAAHIHDALDQVRKLQAFVIERNQFKGYSGKARLAAGVITLAGATILNAPRFPDTPIAHLAGWGAILALGLIVNYTAVIYWFLFNPDVRRNPVMLKPALDAIPPLAVGAVLGFALIRHNQFDLLFGTCLCLYGLAQVAYRRSLPRPIYLLGFYFLGCGALMLSLPGMRFTEPWPMAIAFAVGEIASGFVLIADQRRHHLEDDAA